MKLRSRNRSLSDNLETIANGVLADTITEQEHARYRDSLIRISRMDIRNKTEIQLAVKEARLALGLKPGERL